MIEARLVSGIDVAFLANCWASVHLCTRRIHGIKIAMALAMRAGCVVLSFSVSDQEGLPDEQLAEICRLITEETQAWAAEHGLLGESRDEGSDLSDFVSIQV